MSKIFFGIFVVIILPALVILAGSFGLSKKEDAVSGQKPLVIKNDLEERQCLESFFGNINDYEKSFAGIQEHQKENIIAGITSHHFLAKKLIARFYSGISNKVENVILIGPDHYNVLDSKNVDVVTTELTWNTPYGKIEANNLLIKDFLDKNSNIKISDNAFKMEHSIYIEVPFIKKVFPQAKIIPLIVKNTYDYYRFARLGESLSESVKENSLVIVSSDFSHGATVAETEKYDKQSIDALRNLKLENIDSINCDCRACLAIVFGFLGDSNNFHLIENKNSSDFGGPDKTVTSYVSGYFLDN